MLMLAAEETFTAADAFFVLSATETATTLTTAGLGTLAGARYKPLLSTVPTTASPPGVVFTCHVTRVSDVPKTLA
jgi:hypothetical protein